jgi:hypothetical protein
MARKPGVRVVVYRDEPELHILADSCNCAIAKLGVARGADGPRQISSALRSEVDIIQETANSVNSPVNP